MIYKVETGEFTTDLGGLIGKGYAGKGEHKNKVSSENIKNFGPLPRGKYTIGAPYNSPNTGQFTLPLTPFPDNKMFGRSDFKIHGDDISNPGNASQGCIILPRSSREEINKCTDKILTVV
jgi:hypothetical protein